MSQTKEQVEQELNAFKDANSTWMSNVEMRQFVASYNNRLTSFTTLAAQSEGVRVEFTCNDVSGVATYFPGNLILDMIKNVVKDCPIGFHINVRNNDIDDILSHYLLYESSTGAIASNHCLLNPPQYCLKIPSAIRAVCASEWTTQTLSQLGVQFKVVDFIQYVDAVKTGNCDVAEGDGQNRNEIQQLSATSTCFAGVKVTTVNIAAASSHADYEEECSWDSKNAPNSLACGFEEVVVSSAVDCNSVPATPGESLLSSHALSIVQYFHSLSVEFLDTYKSLSHDDYTKFHQDPICKGSYWIRKSDSCEALVDLFVHDLLHKIGFYSGTLFAYPQLCLSLKFGRDVKKDSIADFTITDLVSYYRVAVIQDKRDNVADTAGEAHMIAEAIAVHQHNNSLKTSHNSKKQKSSEDTATNLPPLIGVRVVGLRFTFYIVKVSQAMLNAMMALTSTDVQTTVLKTSQLDYLVPTERIQIVHILDCVRTQIADDCFGAKRRASFGQKRDALAPASCNCH